MTNKDCEIIDIQFDKPKNTRTCGVIDKQIGENVVEMRLNSKGSNGHMSRAYLAKQLKISYQQVIKYEYGTNRISAATLYKLSKIFKTPTWKFFKGLD